MEIIEKVLHAYDYECISCYHGSLEVPCVCKKKEKVKRKRHQNKCGFCFTKFVRRQPIIGQESYLYKRGNVLCRECIEEFESGKIKCFSCRDPATKYIYFGDSGVGFYCYPCS